MSLKEKFSTAGITMDQLAKKFGFSRQTIYRYFKSYEAGDTDRIDPKVLAFFNQVSSAETPADVKSLFIAQPEQQLITSFSIGASRSIHSWSGKPNSTNMNPLTPKDMINGEYIQDNTEKLDPSVMFNVDACIKARSEFEKRIRDYISKSFDKDYSEYLDEIRSFIVHFQSSDVKESRVTAYKESLVKLRLISEIVKDPVIMTSPLKAVTNLVASVEAAIDDSEKLLAEPIEPVDDQALDARIRDINRARMVQDSEKQSWYCFIVASDDPKLGYEDDDDDEVRPVEVVADSEVEVKPISIGSSIIGAKDLDEAEARFLKSLKNKNVQMVYKGYGPFKNPFLCDDLSSFMRVQWTLKKLYKPGVTLETIKEWLDSMDGTAKELAEAD